MTNLTRWMLAATMLAGLAGCQSSMMVRPAGVEPTPAPGKAMVVFLRPSSLGGAVQSSVYDTADSGDAFIGIVSAKTRVAYQAEPGDHLFMVVAENADFMPAHLDAGKTYYALVSPRMGVWKARFSLLPIRNDAAAKYSLQSGDFLEWMEETSWVALTPESEQWFREHEASIREKKGDYLRKWNSADPRQRAELTLDAGDGR